MVEGQVGVLLRKIPLNPRDSTAVANSTGSMVWSVRLANTATVAVTSRWPDQS
jgi:hypothetical protein